MLIEWGAMVVNGSGKLGGHVASRNKAGSYFRTKTTPLNPQTSSQLGVRASLSALAQQWKSLTAAEQLAWNTAVGSFATTQIFGSSKSISGISLFVRINQNIGLAGGTTILVPPAVITVASLTSLSLTAVGGGAVTLTFAPTPVPANTAIQVRMTTNLSAGIAFVKNHYRTVEYLAPAASSPAVLTTAYTAKFGAPVTGSKIWVECKTVSKTTGLVSLPISTFAVVS